MSYYPLTIQQLIPDTEAWEPMKRVHAIQVNRSGGGESFAAGAGQYHPRLTFVLRWAPWLEALRYSPQSYRIEYRGHLFNIIDYDDYMEQRLTVRLAGEAYG